MLNKSATAKGTLNGAMKKGAASKRAGGKAQSLANKGKGMKSGYSKKSGYK